MYLCFFHVYFHSSREAFVWLGFLVMFGLVRLINFVWLLAPNCMFGNFDTQRRKNATVFVEMFFILKPFSLSRPGPNPPVTLTMDSPAVTHRPLTGLLLTDLLPSSHHWPPRWQLWINAALPLVEVWQANLLVNCDSLLHSFEVSYSPLADGTQKRCQVAVIKLLFLREGWYAWTWRHEGRREGTEKAREIKRDSTCISESIFELNIHCSKCNESAPKSHLLRECRNTSAHIWWTVCSSAVSCSICVQIFRIMICRCPRGEHAPGGSEKGSWIKCTLSQTMKTLITMGT